MGSSAPRDLFFVRIIGVALIYNWRSCLSTANANRFFASAKAQVSSTVCILSIVLFQISCLLKTFHIFWLGIPRPPLIMPKVRIDTVCFLAESIQNQGWFYFVRYRLFGFLMFILAEKILQEDLMWVQEIISAKTSLGRVLKFFVVVFDIIALFISLCFVIVVIVYAWCNLSVLKVSSTKTTNEWTTQ